MPPAIILFSLWLMCLDSVHGQLTWTPIYMNENNQVDLWTKEATGCSCPWNNSDYKCACCVIDGGCHCGEESPNRCTQCGLEKHCNFMCNITIDASTIKALSGKTFGQIKSLSLEGPNICWYNFIPSLFQRVEVQIYRLVNTGKHNGSSCSGGSLQLISGSSDLIYSNTNNHICGINERYSPPVVFFADDGPATLLLKISEKTRRSQFLAYYSFTSVNNSDGLGFHPQGGMKLQNTDCDWLYQDFECKKSVACILASPSYPGLYPPNHQCKYHITTMNENVRVRISITSLVLPQNRCTTDYVSIYQGSTTSSPVLTSLCGSKQVNLEYSGPNLLLEFSSGNQVPPYNYNGFLATLKFYDITETTTKAQVRSRDHISVPTQPTAVVNTLVPYNISACNILISGNNTRSGHFDTREHDWHPTCNLVFQGHPTDVVHISFFNYRLRAPSCFSFIEVYDGSIDDIQNLKKKICSPHVKQKYDIEDENLEQNTYLSTGSMITIVIQQPAAPLSTNEAEFLAGAFFFHDEQISGTMKPNSLCDVIYNSATSPLAGMIDNPRSQHIFWNVDGPLSCSQQFMPESNQSITIKVISMEKIPEEPHCTTQCGDNGCQCVSKAKIEKVDHLLLMNNNHKIIACLCGNLQLEWLPVSVRSWSSLTVVYSIAHYSWNVKGFGFSVSYAFKFADICGDHIITLHSGEIAMKNVSLEENLNHFYYLSCTWTLHSNVERQLELEIFSTQNRPCTAWNISVHEYSNSPNNGHLGDILHTFCSRDSHKLYSLPWKLNSVIIRLHTLSRTLPQFKFKWKSHVVRARYGSPTPAPNTISSTEKVKYSLGLLCILLFRVEFIHQNSVFSR